VHDTFGHDKTLAWSEIDETVLKLNQKVTLEHEEELVFVIVLVPVVLALHHAESYNGIVHLAERLVVPGVTAGGDKLRYVYNLKWFVMDVEMSCVGK
jgi:hypothetical protein